MKPSAIHEQMNELNNEYREKLLKLEEKIHKTQYNTSLAIAERARQHLPQPHFIVCNLL